MRNNESNQNRKKEVTIMPLYVYKCENPNCADEVEEFFSVNNRPDEIGCFKNDCTAKKKFIPFPQPSTAGRVNFKIAGDNSGSQPKRMKS